MPFRLQEKPAGQETITVHRRTRLQMNSSYGDTRKLFHCSLVNFGLLSYGQLVHFQILFFCYGPVAKNIFYTSLILCYIVILIWGNVTYGVEEISLSKKCCLSCLSCNQWPWVCEWCSFWVKNDFDSLPCVLLLQSSYNGKNGGATGIVSDITLQFHDLPEGLSSKTEWTDAECASCIDLIRENMKRLEDSLDLLVRSFSAFYYLFYSSESYFQVLRILTVIKIYL